MSSIDFINVLFAGVYAHVVDKDGITSYSPALTSHVYQAGSFSNPQDIVRGDYKLCGVEGETDPSNPDPNTNPILVPKDAGIEKFDCFEKRFLRLQLPHPYKKFPLEPFLVGGIFGGKAAVPLNKMNQFPSLYAFVYRVKSMKDLALEPVNGSGQRISLDLPPNPPPDENTANLFIYATLNMDMEMVHMDHSGHTRRAFHSLVDMFDAMELTLEIPDSFTPARVCYELPNGLTKDEVEHPSSEGRFGKVNCQHSSLIIWNA